MCGIFGAISLNGIDIQDKKMLVEQGISILRHRGPDDCGIELDSAVCFGHSRLSIIDLESGHQPMRDVKKNGLIVYNGEVYNFSQIRDELIKLGYFFNTKSDTEVILNAYLEWGVNCLDRFRGMFAFAIADFKNKTVFLARDRLGKKPLFYTIKENFFYFSSELEPLYKTIGPLKLDIKSLDDYLYWQYIHAPRTIYKDVYSLEPAHFIKIDIQLEDITKQRYWQLTFQEDKTVSINDWERRLDEKIKESVKIRLVSDVPFGAFLSGGLDSSLVTGYMSEILDKPVKTFSIGFKEADFSELTYAQKIAEINKTEHYAEIVEADSLGLLPLLVRHYGQPFADSSAIPTYYVSKMARKHVKMVLSGDGGDENFAGYNSYEYIIRGLHLNLDNQRLSRIGRYFYLWLKHLSNGNNAVDHAYELHTHTAKHFSCLERKQLLRQEYKNVVSENFHRKSLLGTNNMPMISRLQNLDLMAYLPYDILTKVDIASMANSLEVRTPLLDHELVELAATIPAEFKLKEEKASSNTYIKKYILKRIAKNRYSEELVNRPKMGFGVPLKFWFATKLKQDVSNRLLSSKYLPELFNMDEIYRIIDMHSSTCDYSTRIWNLLFLAEWIHSHPDSL